MIESINNLKETISYRTVSCTDMVKSSMVFLSAVNADRFEILSSGQFQAKEEVMEILALLCWLAKRLCGFQFLLRVLILVENFKAFGLDALRLTAKSYNIVFLCNVSLKSKCPIR